MSTTFAVKIPSEDQFYTKVALRWSTGTRVVGITLLNPQLFLKLPNDTPVFPLDNTAQGIETINDIKNSLREYLKYAQSKGKKIYKS